MRLSDNFSIILFLNSRFGYQVEKLVVLFIKLGEHILIRCPIQYYFVFCFLCCRRSHELMTLVTVLYLVCMPCVICPRVRLLLLENHCANFNQTLHTTHPWIKGIDIPSNIIVFHLKIWWSRKSYVKIQTRVPGA